MNTLKNILKKYPPAFNALKYIYYKLKKFLFYTKKYFINLTRSKDLIHTDIVLSIGNNCKAAEHMQMNYLRKFASPLDWMKGYKLDFILDLFRSDFKTFFKEYYEDVEKSKENGNCRCIIDTKSGMAAIHHIYKKDDLKGSMESFKDKQLKRFYKIRSYLQKARHITLISCRYETIKELSIFLVEFSKLFNAKITLINFNNLEHPNPDPDIFKKNYKINDDINIIEYKFCDAYPFTSRKIKSLQKSNIPIENIAWIGNYKVWGGGANLCGTIKYNRF